MNKLIKLLSFLLVINLLILGNLIIKQYNTVDLLPISYAQTAKHNNDNYNLITSILKDTNKNNLMKYADYFEIQITENIPNLPKSNIAFTLSLPEQVSFIAIYDKIDNNNYKFKYLIDDLSLVDNFHFYNNFLIVEQTDKSVSTEFNDKKIFEVFSKKEDEFTSIFKKSTYSERIISKDNNNFKEIEISSIDYVLGDIPKILCIVTTSVYKLELFSSEKNESLEKIKEITKKEVYDFNYDKNTFDLTNSDIIR
ncbi:hypothetical protein [Romboutsia lituseburensis]|uniref:hypothetical protein n=1 Tax=Romboutsia lituseburensis TaxID=1537 RepID=UPI00215AA60A|nr:hypothetical protein [Romboutsia lituseburensis]MCR8746545.1 hypothetical protein [Romboutsia lituseburensis]